MKPINKLITTLIAVTLLVSVTYVHATNNNSPHEITRPLLKKSFFGQAKDNCAQSDLMKHIKNWLISHDIDPHADKPLASEQFQQLGHQAHFALDVPKEQHVPIRSIPPTRIILPTQDSFTTGFNTIFLNEQADRDKYFLNHTEPNPATYGIFNCALHHEAAHVKYNDPLVGALMHRMPFFISAPLILSRPTRIKTVAPLLILSLVSGKILHRQHLHYTERRADIEGCYATGCHTCVTQTSDSLRSGLTLHQQGITTCINAIGNPTSELTKKQAYARLKFHQDQLRSALPYASPEEMRTVADQLKKENKECIVHAQHRKKQE